MQVSISDPVHEQAIKALIQHHQTRHNETLTIKEAVGRLLDAGIKAASQPAKPKEMRPTLAAPTPNEVQAFCEENELKPYTKGLGLVMNIREACENWKEQVTALYKPKQAPLTMQINQ